MIRSSIRRVIPIALIALGGCGKKAPAPVPPVPVSVAKVSLADVPQLVVATGTAEPIQSAAVQAQVSGELIHVRFQEGDKVTAGQVLFEIDPRPFLATLAQAQSNLARDAAQVQNARNDVQRYQALAAKDYVTKQQLDQAEATASALSGTLGADSAAITQARLNVQYATIRSPITGRAGSVLVKEGNQVRGGSGQTLVVINQISPILVRFPVQAAMFAAVRQRAGKGLVVNVSPVGDSTHAEQGTLIFLDNAVDSNTGTVLLKAHFENRNAALWPGALESVSLQLDVQHNALVVPSSAVQNGQNGSVVWVVDSTRHAHTVKVGVVRSNDSVTIISGSVRPGQTVVTDGQLRLTDSAVVSILAPRRPSSDSGAPGAVDTASAKGSRP
ncbi:MAG TPA: efflux RND transporter periplasmic adaptor subunit [Gemmatimonadales bacterium]|jgi:multidrug efflux system membrane fusion protein